MRLGVIQEKGGEMKKEIQIGQEVEDIVTGFKGIAGARVEYLNGCIQFYVKGRVQEPGKMPEGEYIDESQLKIIGNGVFKPAKIKPSIRGTGGSNSKAPGGSTGLASKKAKHIDDEMRYI